MKLIGRGRAPDIVAFKALLTGEPIGEWHMVVGNPYNPILRVGNLICTGAKFQFNDTLGADNFPTELKVAITLEHGRPRDQGDIESMFNDGNGRIYYAPASRKDVFSSGATRGSLNDNSNKPGAAQINSGQIESKTGKIKSGGIPKNNKKSMPLGKNTGNGGTINQIVDNLTYAFHGNGHDLAVKMGLASGGSWTSNDKEPVMTNAEAKGTK
jgi:hypothetical protein